VDIGGRPARSAPYEGKMTSKPTFVNNTESEILCPDCKPARKPVVKTNRTTGNQFLGCPSYPECTFTREIPEAWILRANGQLDLFSMESGQ
jgi:ssDNA-binding Zn-finger/Zn-ribbon topoisomerase 1